MAGSREASWKDALMLAPRLREADRQEILASTGRGPEVALTDAFSRSDMARVIYDKDPDDIVAIYGLVSLDRDIAAPWMMATDALDRVKTPFLRQSKTAVEEMHRLAPLLTNYVDARNTVHIRWLKWLGFTFLRTVPYGEAGLPFHEFVRLEHV